MTDNPPAPGEADAGGNQQPTGDGPADLTEILAEQLLATRTQLQELAVRVGDLTDVHMGDLQQQLVVLGQQVAEAELAAEQNMTDIEQELSKALGRLEGAAPDQSVKPQRFRLERADVPAARAAQQELAAWVPWLVNTYSLHDYINPCWPRHDGIAEELAGIYLAWLAAWSKKGDDNSIVTWHEQLARLRPRLSDWTAGAQCGQRCGLDIPMQRARQDTWLSRLTNRDNDYRLERTQQLLPAPLPPKPANAAAKHEGNH